MIDAARAELLKRLAHDLRSPLAVLKGSLADLGAGQAPEREPPLRRAERAVDRLLRLADRLSLAAATREGLTLNSQTVELRPLVEAAIAAVLSAEPRAKVSREVQGEARWVGDPALLEAALRELLSNAFRYARAAVRVEVGPDAVVVEDDGPGLEPVRAGEVFRALQPTAHGLGLGLPLAAALARAMGLSLEVAPNEGGAWSRFSLRR